MLQNRIKSKSVGTDLLGCDVLVSLDLGQV